MLDRLSILYYLCYMNALSTEKKAQILRLLVEGTSIRAITRITGASKNTVTKLLVDIGKACQGFHNQGVVKVKAERVQCDEIWAFVGCKEKAKEKGAKGDGDVWTWVGIDADTKLVISWLVGDRDADAANTFMLDVADRLANRVQLTTDGHKPYLRAVENAFEYDIDYAMLIKMYGSPDGATDNERRYSPAACTGAKKTRVMGDPNPKFVSTSYVERQNLTMRMHMRRFTRLTNAFSKKIENHCYAISLHFVYYNFCKIHSSLSVTPAMQSGLMKKPMTIEDIVNLVVVEAPKKRGSYKKAVTTVQA
jgi:IS1 family transposase